MVTRFVGMTQPAICQNTTGCQNYAFIILLAAKCMDVIISIVICIDSISNNLRNWTLFLWQTVICPREPHFSSQGKRWANKLCSRYFPIIPLLCASNSNLEGVSLCKSARTSCSMNNVSPAMQPTFLSPMCSVVVFERRPECNNLACK